MLATSLLALASSPQGRACASKVFKVNITFDEAVQFYFGLRIIVVAFVAVVFGLSVYSGELFDLSVGRVDHFVLIGLSVAVQPGFEMLAEGARINLRWVV